MKILFAHNFYQQSGGERVVVEQQSRLLMKRGDTVIKFTRDSREIKNYGAREKIKFFPNTVYNQESYDQIQEVINRENPEVAHIHNVFPLLSPSIYFAIHETNTPIVQSLHNFRFLCPNGQFYVNNEICERCKFGNTLHAVVRKCYHQSYLLSSLYAFSIGANRIRGWFNLIDKFIAPTDFVAKKLIESGAIAEDKIAVVGNFIPDIHYLSLSAKNIKPPYVLYLGRLSPEKGVLTLIKTMKNLPELKLRIAGEGPQRTVLEEYIKNNSIINIEFHGYVSDSEKWCLINNALATVIPSECYETFGMSALESLIIGTPVIASDIGGLPNFIESGHNGLLFRAGDSQDLLKKIRLIVSSPNILAGMSNSAMSSAKQRFNEETHYNELMKIYSEVLV